jgi:4-hydroxy-tetrahydrodipicolinate synthase
MELNLAGIPQVESLVVAVATPLDREFHPDISLMLDRCRSLLRDGCDGIALFGTTGEGTELSVSDRSATLDSLIRGGIDPERLIVSVSALALPDIVRLAQHALERNVAGILLMPPCVYRSGITEEGTFQFFSAAIDRVGREDLRLYLYHFPEICGAAVSPRVIRRLDEKYPGAIAGVKDSGGDFNFTEGLLRRFSHLSIYTGSEIHVPQALARGARGTICGLANVMPRLLRGMFDLPTEFERRRIVPLICSGDAILCRAPFIAAVKAVIADATHQAAWSRTIPPMAQIPMRDMQWILRDFRRWEESLPANYRTLYPVQKESVGTVVAMRRG